MVKSKFKDKTIFGMMNVGTNPTVDGKNQSIEVHFFNFNQDIYNTELKIEFLKRLRSEEKFQNLNALKIQLNKDMENATTYIKTLNA